MVQKNNNLLIFFLAFKGIVLSKDQPKEDENNTTGDIYGMLRPAYSYYTVLVTRVYKGDVKSKEDTYSRFFKVTVRTYQHEAVCGMQLKAGKSYVITGRKIQKHLHINHCDWIEEYSEISKNMKRGLRGEYNCECSVNTCIDGYCDNESPCKWSLNYSEPIDECTRKHRICTKDKEGQCGWNDSIFYDACTNHLIFDNFKLPRRA